MKNLCRYNLIITTRLGLENIVQAMINELFNNTIDTINKPFGYKGLLLAKINKKEELDDILIKIPYIEKAIYIDTCTEAKIENIVEKTLQIIEGRITEKTSFAVRTIRRGQHDFTSIDVNIKLGSAIQEKTRAMVNLDYPEKIILVNILQDTAFISIIDGKELYKKRSPDKPELYKIFRRFIVVQEPYLGDKEATYKMGVRLGRSLQNYEIGDYYIGLIEPVDAEELSWFINGLKEGINSRYTIQVKSYGRDVIKTKTHVYDMYSLIRIYNQNPIIILEPEGKYIASVEKELKELLTKKKRPVFLLGSRHGVPSGLYRYADIIIDITPGITLSTEYALPTALGAISMLFRDGEK